jgi:thioredoxin-like negative regulator of GroEL
MSEVIVDIKDIHHLDGMLENWNAVVVLFTAPSWCVPCQRLEPHYQALAEKMTDVVFCRVDADLHGNIVSDFGVQSVPTIILFRHGGFDDKRLAGRTVNQLFTEIKEAIS